MMSDRRTSDVVETVISKTTWSTRRDRDRDFIENAETKTDT